VLRRDNFLILKRNEMSAARTDPVTPRSVKMAMFIPFVAGSSRAPKQTGHEKEAVWLKMSAKKSNRNQGMEGILMYLSMECLMNTQKPVLIP
jgi:hypothetical protein